MADGQRRQRQELLRQLTLLECEAKEAATTTVYVERRAQLLQALAQVQAPWSEEEKQLLMEALAAGDRAMASMGALRDDVVAKMKALQQRRKFVPIIQPPELRRARRVM